MPFCFGEFELDDDGRELRRRSRRIDAPPKTLAFLHTLVRSAPRVVTRAELLAHVWDGQIVSPSALNTVVKSLRRILDDRAQQAVRTVHGIGYAFTLPVEHARASGVCSTAPRPVLADARRRLFVGRERELARLSSWFRASKARTPSRRDDARLFWVHGVGGVGKTTLVHCLEALAHEHAVPIVTISCAHVLPNPEGLMNALAFAVGASTAADVPRALAASPAGVLVLDGYEAFRGIDDWIRERFLQRLPGGWRLVIAGRRAPSARWRADPSWTHAVELPLGLLDEDDASALLERRGIPEIERSSIVRFAGGHPLTLVLAASTLRRAELVREDAVEAEAVATSLVDSLPRDAPSRRERDALECLAVVETLDEHMLAALLDDPSAAPDCFDWLSTLGMVERAPAGLVLHELARTTLAANLAWRNRARFIALVRRYHDELYRLLAESSSLAERRRLVASLLRLVAIHPSLAPLMQRLDTCGVASRAELAAIAHHVERFDGSASAAALRFWVDRDPTCASVIRDDDGTMLGYGVFVELDPDDVDARAADPLVPVIDAALPRRAKTSVARWFADCRAYHALTPISLRSHQLHAERDFAAMDPELAYHVVLVADPDAWKPIVEIANFGPPLRSVASGGHELTLFAIDFVERPLATWFESFTRGVIDTLDAELSANAHR